MGNVNEDFIKKFLSKDKDFQKKQEALFKKKRVEEYYSKPKNKITDLNEDAKTQITSSINKIFENTKNKSLNKKIKSIEGSWTTHMTPYGIFFHNKEEKIWVNNFGKMAYDLIELIQLSTIGDIPETYFRSNSYEPPLPEPTSSLDYEVFATDWGTDPLTNYGWGTEAYVLYSMVPSPQLISTGANGYRPPSDSTGSSFNLNNFKTKLVGIPESRRVVNMTMWWDDIPALTSTRRDYYEVTADATSYLGETFLTPWCDVETADVKSSFIGVLNACKNENIVIPYFTDNRGLEVVGSLYSLQGDHTYWDGNGAFDGAGNPTYPIQNPNSLQFPYWYPDARYFAAWINDSRFNNYVLSTSGKSLAATMVDYYNVLSGQSLSISANTLYSKAAGITAFNDFTYYGGYYEHPFSYYGPGAAVSEVNRVDETYRSQAWLAGMDALSNGHYAVKNIVEAKNSISYYANSLYSSYEIFPVGITEANFYRDSNDQKLLKPVYNNLSGGQGWYGWHGNIIYPYAAYPNYPPSYTSGYVLNPQTDDEKYNWAGHNNPSYTPSVGSTLVRYASNPSANLTQWRKQVVHKQFVNDIKLLRVQHRSKTDFHLYHTPFLATNYDVTGPDGAPSCLYNEFYDESRYFREFVYHTLLHGVAYVMNYWANKQTLQEVLDEWRTISYNSKSVPCSNSTGDISLPVDRLILSDAITNMVMSGGRLTKTGKYLWRITLPPTAKRVDNTIVLQRVGTASDLPEYITIDCSDPINGYGTWIKRTISTPPNYVVVAP
jgi:hypothetical protein